jgi:hypothetical protein
VGWLVGRESLRAKHGMRLMPGALPCPDCGCDTLDCTLFADDFNRADTTTLSDYTEVSGNWAIVSNRLDPPAALEALLKVNLSTPVSPDGVRISAVCNFGSATGHMGLIVDYVDSSNYQYANIECTGSASATLQLIQVSGGTPNNLTTATSIPSFSWSADTSLTVCWDGEYIAATIGDITVPTLTDAAATTDGGGDFTGLRIASVGTSARFDDLNVSSMADGCPRCSQCDSCELDELQVDLAGFSDGACACSGLNGTHFIPFQPPDSGCLYFKEFDFVCAVNHFVSVSLLTGLDAIRVAVGDDGGGLFDVQFDKSGIGDCTAWSALDIPLTSSTNDANCSSSSPTCALTST